MLQLQVVDHLQVSKTVRKEVREEKRKICAIVHLVQSSHMQQK